MNPNVLIYELFYREHELSLIKHARLLFAADKRTSRQSSFLHLRLCRRYITRTKDTVFRHYEHSTSRVPGRSYKLRNEDLLKVRRRAADVVLANVAVVEVAHVRVLEDALQALHREVRQLSVNRELVQVVHRVTGPDPLALQVVRLYAGLRVGQLVAALLLLPLARAVLYDTRRERSHADLYLAGSLGGQQLHLQNRTFSRCAGDYVKRTLSLAFIAAKRPMKRSVDGASTFFMPGMHFLGS